MNNDQIQQMAHIISNIEEEDKGMTQYTDRKPLAVAPQDLFIVATVPAGRAGWCVGTLSLLFSFDHDLWVIVGLVYQH
ncbi:MAG: hypothetical protein ABW166_12650 [Sedimenticola sp.]